MSLRPARIRQLAVCAALGALATARMPARRTASAEAPARSSKLSRTKTCTIACAPDDRDSAVPADENSPGAVHQRHDLLPALSAVQESKPPVCSPACDRAHPLEVAPKTSPPCAGPRAGVTA